MPRAPRMSEPIPCCEAAGPVRTITREKPLSCRVRACSTRSSFRSASGDAARCVASSGVRIASASNTARNLAGLRVTHPHSSRESLQVQQLPCLLSSREVCGLTRRYWERSAQGAQGAHPQRETDQKLTFVENVIRRSWLACVGFRKYRRGDDPTADPTTDAGWFQRLLMFTDRFSGGSGASSARRSDSP